MLRGVSFQCGCAGDFLLNLDKLMDISKYEWYVDDVELNCFEFRSGRYSGAEYKDALYELSKLSFARIRRYPVGSAVSSMDTYEDYRESDCDLLILFFDGGFYEIYAKEEALIHEIFKRCMDNEFENLEYVNDENDGRYRMYF